MKVFQGPNAVMTLTSKILQANLNIQLLNKQKRFFATTNCRSFQMTISSYLLSLEVFRRGEDGRQIQSKTEGKKAPEIKKKNHKKQKIQSLFFR